MSDETERSTSPEYTDWCGTMRGHNALLDTTPDYAENRALIEETASAYERAHESGERRTAREGVIDIPVVVHVVHSTDEQNISDAQIRSQIDVLNRDFRKQNLDVGNVPQAWRNIVADARIGFHLAGTDPLGQPTNGITRTRTSVASFDAPDPNSPDPEKRTDNKVKFAQSGGQNAWPADAYLNIWVCQLTRGLLGYAQFPGGPAATDGVVITHTGFGTNGTATAPFNGGRTTTHEIGHWLNLRHIWGDKRGCAGDDFVADTPNQEGPNFGTPAFPHVTCNNAPNGDMFMNFMDYTDDVAMFMFSAGQVARMESTFENARRTFATRQLVMA
ncbi:zinc metalloprotease [Streptomyces sp. NPDC048506]|uniref:zinc metalloprotease n=1 Tax=Streptomyces sp. NPDC048506 TaxID=3155028 RepID=UPI003429C3D2